MVGFQPLVWPSASLTSSPYLSTGARAGSNAFLRRLLEKLLEKLLKKTAANCCRWKRGQGQVVSARVVAMGRGQVVVARGQVVEEAVPMVVGVALAGRQTMMVEEAVVHGVAAVHVVVVRRPLLCRRY
jgi:hypothetical protein